MRALRLLPLVALLALPATLAGCGGTLKLPTETRGFIPADSSYQILSVFTGFADIQAVELTPVGEMFVLFNRGGSGTASRGEIGQYALANGTPISRTWPTLYNPYAIASGRDTIYVLDRGDTCLARTNLRTGSCDHDSASGGRVTNLSVYWRVVQIARAPSGIYDTVSTFTDTTMAWVNGVTVDSQGRVYVSGLAIVNVPDPLDNRIRTRSFLPRVWRYDHGPRYVGVSPNDPNMPGAAWHRDSTWAITNGTGFGFVTNSIDVHWSPVGGTGVFVTDAGQNTVKRISDLIGNSAYFQVQPDQLEVDGVDVADPGDVTGDASGFFYFVDSGNRRVLRYDPQGQYVQQVDPTHQLVDPVALAANDTLVYVADRTPGKLYRFKRRL